MEKFFRILKMIAISVGFAIGIANVELGKQNTYLWVVILIYTLSDVFEKCKKN
jgi:hypothetical protein